MGQRLNLEIKDGDTVLANAYYHWSGYTSSTIYLIEKALEVFDETKPKLPMAIEMLVVTGAGFTDKEIEYIKTQVPTEGFEAIKWAEHKAVDRNKGLLAISPEGIEETQAWEEHRAIIDIASKTIDMIDLFYELDESEFIESKAKDIPNINIEEIPFSEFESFTTTVEENGGITYDGNCYTTIE